MAEAAETAPSLQGDEASAWRAAVYEQAVQAIVLGVILLAFFLHVLTPWLAYGWLQRPFLGAFVEQTHLFNDLHSSGERVWPAFAAGIRPFDRLVAIDGVPVPTSTALTARLARFEFGQVVQLEVERAGRALTVTVPLTRFETRDLITHFIVPYLIGWVYLIIGLWVFRLRRGEPAGRVFALFCASAATVVGGLFDLYTTHAFTWAWTVAIPTGSAALITLGLVFPQEMEAVQRRPALRLASFVPTLILAGYALYSLYAPGVDPRAYILAWRYEYFYMGVGILYFLGVVVYRATASRSPIAREQSRIILIGAVAAFAPTLIWALLQPILAESFPFNAATFLPPLVFFPAAVAYAILRYRLVDTDAIVGQGLIYAAIGSLSVVAYGLIVTGASLLAGTMLPADNPILLGLFAFLVVLAFNPLRARLQRAIDYAFFRGSRAAARQLEDFGRALTRAVALDDVVGALSRQIEDALRPAHFYLFLRDPVNNDYGAYAENERTAPSDLRFAPNSALAGALARERSAIYLTPETPLPSQLLGDRARLALLGSAVYVPLTGQSGLTGWLAIGPKLSGEPYSREELRFVEALADQSALAIERAMVITDLERRVKELNVLSQMSQAVNFTIAFNDLLELIYAQTSKIVNTQNFYIILKDARGTSFRYVFYVENNERIGEQENKAWPMGRGLATEIVRTGRPIRADDYLAECRRRGVVPRARTFKAWMGVPLNAGAEIIGVMSVASFDEDEAFTDEQLKVFWAIADQAASAIVKAQLFQQTELRARQLASLNEVSASMASMLELDPLLERITQSSADILACEAGSLFLTDEETGDYIFRVAVGPVGQHLVGTRIARGRGFVGEAVESGSPIIVNDVQNDPRWFKGSDESTGFITRALMVVPLQRGDRHIGAIEVINKRDGRPFDEEDKGLLTAFAGQAAVAIENARLFTQTDQELAERVEELSVMQRIDRELNIALDIQRVMSITLDWAMRNTRASAGEVGIVVEEGLATIAMRGYTEAQERRSEPLRPLGAGWVGQVVSSGAVSLVRDPNANPEGRGLRDDTRAVLTIPIKRERAVLGLLSLESPDPEAFTPKQVDFVTRLLDHASIAITNARLYAEVHAANLAKSSLMDFVAHELKTPMTPIKGYADWLLSGSLGPLNDTQRQFLVTILNNIERMRTIVTDLNDSASLEAGKLRLAPESISVAAVVDDVLRTTQSVVEAKQQTINVDLPPDLPNVWADHGRTVQILTNLVSNAHKYTPEGGSLTIRVARADNTWDPDGAPEVLHVSVQDTGIGIAPEDQKKLFQKFFRADDRLAREMAPGTGLGLSIVKNLVELQGGRIWFESEFRRGSTFHFTIPLAVPETSPAPQA